MVIAIDGPAGAGKSTAAKKVAEKLRILYLDTGAMYRAFTLHVLERGTPLDDLAGIERNLDDFPLRLSENRVFIGERDVTGDIRGAKVNEHVSHVSSIPCVRKKMVELQRQIGDNRDIVVEGRDIGTVVFPRTPYKFFLDASVEERAKRRLDEEARGERLAGFSVDTTAGSVDGPKAGPAADTAQSLESMIAKISRRDHYDSTRNIAPLLRADEAVYIDSTHMTAAEVAERILRAVKEKS